MSQYLHIVDFSFYIVPAKTVYKQRLNPGLEIEMNIFLFTKPSSPDVYSFNMKHGI